jgi:acetoin utilization deacetylase AcuC-like enzyme
MSVSTEGYGVLTDRIASLAESCGAGLGLVLEGGYGMESLADGVGAVHETLSGRVPVGPDDDPTPDAVERIEAARAAHGLDG